MPKKENKTPPAAPAASGDQKPRSRVEVFLKWVGGIGAVLSLIFGLNQLTQLISEVRERQRQIAELAEVGRLQQGAADYNAAWASFDQAVKAAESGGKLAKLTGQLSKERLEMREAQENLAMAWLQNIRVSQGQTFSDIVDKLAPVLNRGVASSSGARKADLLAHVGWANFLRWREGREDLNPEPQYQQAVEIDSVNPYAHAYWGHWKLWRREGLAEARPHFSAALASGRVRDYVRRLQLAALKNLGSEGEGEFLAVVNDMRKNNEKFDAQIRHEIFSIYSFTCAYRYDAGRLAKLLAALPATEQLATFRALFYDEHDEEFDEGKRPGCDACLATLLVAAGQPEEALRIWQALSETFPPEDGGLGDRSREAIKNLSASRL